MRKPFRVTLTADGTSDRALIPILRWALQRCSPFADIGFATEFHSRHGLLTERIGDALKYFPADLLFVHRDAESASMEVRQDEISKAMSQIHTGRFVPVIPVRMTEAWLLIDPSALRRAADNPHGKTRLDFPPLPKLDQLPDAKQTCDALLISASGKSGRRLKRFKQVGELAQRRYRLAELIADYAPLLRLTAFKAFLDATTAEAERLINDTKQ